MSNVTGGQGCPMKCWSAAGAIGVVTALILIAVAGKGVMAGLILGILAAVLLGLLFTWLFCAPVPAIGASGNVADAAVASAEPAAATPSPAPIAQPVAAEPVAAVPEKPVEAAPVVAEAADAAADVKETEIEASDTVVKPTAALAGQDELSGKKGDWRYEGGEAAQTETPEAAQVPDTPVAAESVVKPSTALAGQAELAEKKGTWRYEGGDASPKADESPAVDAGKDYDGDGILEGTEEGTRPALLDGPGEGGADNLKEIKGIGPKLEKVCHGLGVYHFSQIAAWSEDEVAWANANLVGFKGRVTRDNWVEQAKILAAGGETEFSKRVDKGGVY